MRMKAKAQLTYFGTIYQAGALFDALPIHARDLISQDKAEPFNLEDPSTRRLSRLIDGLPTDPPVMISPAAATVAAAGGTGNFDVTMTGPGASGTWTVSKDDAAWLTISSPTAPQATDGQVNYNVAANVGDARTANIYVNDGTFTVNQDAGAPARK